MASPYIIITVLILASTLSTFAVLVDPKTTKTYILAPYALSLECSFKNESKVEWYHNDTLIGPGKPGFSMTSVDDKSRTIYTLTKSNTTFVDAGKYTCKGKSESLDITVSVFKVITHDIIIVSKEPASIKCELQNLAKSEVTKFYWTKNYTVLEDVPEIQGRYNENITEYILDIPKSKRRDNGLYNCVFKIGGQDFSIDVNMNMAPWIESMEKSRNLVQGDKLHLECNVVSHPFASVYWKKDNETFRNDASNRVFLDKNRTLIIYDLNFSDRGHYTCVATNNVNSTSMTVLVRVKDKLAALWPFLGIVAEVVILCIIIFICEKRRSKEMEDEYENTGQQAMPNAKDHKGKDEIRQRNVRT